MISAGMTFAVFVIVMIAGRVLVLNKCLCKESRNCLVSASHITAVKSDASFLHSHLCASADASADKNVSLSVPEKACKSTVSGAVRVNYLLVYYLSVGDIVELELLCPAEMLEDLSVFIGYCYPHDTKSFPCDLL